MSLLLLILYFIGIQYQRDGWWLLVLPITLLAFVLDVFLNFTELALLTWDFPRKGEWTFSTRLARLRNSEGWQGTQARYFIRCLDAIAPNGKHVN